MSKKILLALFALIAFVLAIVGYLLLPSQVVIQIGLDGNPSNTVPKVIAVLIPLVISLFGVVQYYGGGDEGEEKTKYVLVIAAGYLVQIITLVVNLK